MDIRRQGAERVARCSARYAPWAAGVLLATGLLAAFAPLTATAASSWSDSFETYAVGSQMHGQGGWKGWDNVAAAGALVAATPAHTGTRSVTIAGNSDLVQEYSFATSGKWIYTAWQFIPTNFAGTQYFILMNTYQAGGSQSWSVQVWMDTGSGKVGSDFDGAKLPLVKGRWVELRVEIDLTADVQKFYYDNQLLYQKSWTAGVSGWGARNIAAVDLYANGTSAVYYDDISLRPANFPPTVATPATVSAATGTCVNASVLAADDGGESNLVYTWSATGPAAVTFVPNASNPAKATQATFTQAGTYQFTVQVADAQGLTTQSTVSVTVAATPARVVVTPATVARDPLTTCLFSAQAYDQFNALLASQPAFIWSAQGISINASGLATADGDAGVSYTVLAKVGSLFGSAILQINSVNALPAPVITPNGGTFDQPLTVTITPAVSTVLGNTPGWRTGVKYPGQGIETVEALSQDGTTVAAMRGRTMAKSTYLFPSASMSPDSGPFPFYIWSLADLNGPANQFMIYAPSLFAGVTENTAWDGNNYDFYYGETGNRVFLLLQQHYSHSISLWSCAAGTKQGDTANQMLANLPLPSLDTLAGSATRIEFAGDKVRVRVGATPLVSATTDADGWVTYTGTNGSGRVTAPLGDTRFWLTLAGGEKPGKREFVVSDKPRVTTRFTYDGSPVTETSLAVTNTFTLTHDATFRARVYSAAAYHSPETVAVFTSTIPQLPSESYVSPAYITITHHPLDGSAGQVSVEGPSGIINGIAIQDYRYILRYPLSDPGPTPLTLHRNGVADLSQDVTWLPLEIGIAPDMLVRRGESLLLKAGVGQTGALQIDVRDSSNQIYRTCSGTAGEAFPVLFDRPGIFTAIATLDGVSIGSMAIGVAYVNFDGPIACQVGYKREKGVEVYGPVDQIYFTAKNPKWLEVSVKVQTEYGVRLYLKPLDRGTPVVQARLGSTNGPVIAEQEIDEFTLDIGAAEHVAVNGATDTANTIMTMKPWIPNLDVNCAMFAHYSTFAGGATVYALKTSDFDAKDVNGGPAIELAVDPSTGETQAIIHVDLEIPDDESSYCFRVTFDQHSKYGTVVLEANCNGTKDKWELTEAYWGQSETGAKNVTVKCLVGHTPGKPHTVVSADADFAVVGTGAISCTPGASFTINVNKTAVKTAGIYNLKIEDTLFAVLHVFKLESVVISTEHGDIDHGAAKNYTAKAYDSGGNDVTPYVNFQWNTFNPHVGSAISTSSGAGTSFSKTWNIEGGSSSSAGDAATTKEDAGVFCSATCGGETVSKNFSFNVNKGTVTSSTSWYDPDSDTTGAFTDTDIGSAVVVDRTDVSPPPTVTYTVGGDVTVSGSLTVSGSATAKVGVPLTSVKAEVTLGVSGTAGVSVSKPWSLSGTVTASSTYDIQIQMYRRRADRVRDWTFKRKKVYSTTFEETWSDGTVHATTDDSTMHVRFTNVTPQ